MRPKVEIAKSRIAATLENMLPSLHANRHKGAGSGRGCIQGVKPQRAKFRRLSHGSVREHQHALPILQSLANSLTQRTSPRRGFAVYGRDEERPQQENHRARQPRQYSPIRDPKGRANKRRENQGIEQPGPVRYQDGRLPA